MVMTVWDAQILITSVKCDNYISNVLKEDVTLLYSNN